MQPRNWIVLGAAAVLLAGCGKDVSKDDGLGVGAQLSVDYLGNSDVVGFHYFIERVSCNPGDPIEPFAFEALVDLQDQLAPGGVTVLDVFDDQSGHVFADVFVTLDPGCYDITATPVSEMDALAGTYTASEDCSVATAEDVEVQEGVATEVPPLVSQCEGGPDMDDPDDPVALNHPPEFDVAIDDRFGFECEVLEVCAAVSDPDNDPVELVWSQTAGAALFEPIAVGPLTETDFDGGRQYYEQCATFTAETVGDYGFEVTVYDLLEDGSRIEDSLEVGLQSHTTMDFPLLTSRGVEPHCIGLNGSMVPLGEDITQAAGCDWQTPAEYYCDPANAAAAGFPLADTCPGGVFDPQAAFPACEVVQGDEVWSAYHDHPDDDHAGGVAVATDGVYVCGHEDYFASGSGRNAILTKYDFDGNVLWSAEPFGGPEDYCAGVVVGSDDNPVIAGSVWSGWFAAVRKLDGATGAEMWAGSYSSVDDRFYGIGIAPNDDVVPVGTSFVGGYNDVLAQRYDTDGNLLWTTVQSVGPQDFGYGAAVSSGGNVYVVGMTDDLAGTLSGSLLRLDGSTGSLVWSDLVSGASIDEFADVTIDLTDDRPIVLGRDRDGDNLMVRKYNFGGGVNWTQVLSGSAHAGSSYGDGGIAADADGTVYFAASAASATADLWVRAFDGSNGDEIWSLTLDPQGSDAFGRDIAVSSDSLYVVGDVDTGASFDIAAFRLVK